MFSVSKENLKQSWDKWKDQAPVFHPSHFSHPSAFISIIIKHFYLNHLCNFCCLPLYIHDPALVPLANRTVPGHVTPFIWIVFPTLLYKVVWVFNRQILTHSFSRWFRSDGQVQESAFSQHTWWVCLSDALLCKRKFWSLSVVLLALSELWPSSWSPMGSSAPTLWFSLPPSLSTVFFLSTMSGFSSS